MDHQENLPPHVLIFPLPLQGPVNSMLKLAELLCLSGFHITFVVTDYIHGRLLRYSNIQSRFDSYPGFQIKTISDGLPEDHPHLRNQFLELVQSLKTKTKPFFKEMLVSGHLNPSPATRRPVTCIIADGILGFTCDVAKEVGLPIFHVRTISACCLWVFFCLPRLIDSGELPFKDDDLDKLVKGVPGTESFLRRRDLPGFCRSGDLTIKDIQLYKREAEENARADGLILNTFEELEGPMLEQMRSVCPNIYPIGPLHAHLKTKFSAGGASPELASSNSLWEEDKNCVKWLDKQGEKSVLYVSFGSIATLTKLQLIEFWHGLVNSGVKFLWVMRPDSITEKDWEESIPAEVRDGTEKRGYIAGWAPQEEVLAHRAVGGFLTHSGWNSTLESVYEGVPMITWPYFLDQQVNSRFVEAFWKVGLDMKDTCDRAVVERLVRELMEVRKEEFSERSEKLSRLAKGCLSSSSSSSHGAGGSDAGGSSHCNLQRLVKDIESLVSAAASAN